MALTKKMLTTKVAPAKPVLRHPSVENEEERTQSQTDGLGSDDDTDMEEVPEAPEETAEAKLGTWQ